MRGWGFGVAGRRRRLIGICGVTVLVVMSAAFALSVGAVAGVSAPRFAAIQRAPEAPIGAKLLGAPAADATQSGYVVLKPRDPQALQSFIASVSKPHSALYHHYLAAGQFAGRFGPSSATVSAVKAQLKADGLDVTSVARDNLLIGFSGTTSSVQSAFSTKLERYTSAAGITGEQTTKAISLPSDISRDVASVVGLNTLVHPEADLVRAPVSAHAGHLAAKTAKITSYAAGAPQPCADATSVASETGGLTDDQIANAYGATPLYAAGDLGSGISIGVYELEPFSTADLTTFDQCYFGQSQGATMAGAVTTKYVDETQAQAVQGPGSGESILDIEDVSAMAPGAHIDVYEAPNSSAGSLDDYAQMVNDDQDQIITSSWGLCEQDEQLADPGAQQAENYIFEQAAAQGQTVLNAAGDTGDDTCNEVRSVPPPSDQNPLSVGDPASQPYVLAVGGTTIQDADPANYSETVWNDGAEWGGGGGGFSTTWAAPSWQLSNSYFSGSGYTTDLGNANDLEQNAPSLGLSDQSWPEGFCANNPGVGFSSAGGGDSLPNEPCRAVPDVSAQADEFTGAVTIFSASFETSGGGVASGWITIGGTSSATPIWAAMLALVDASTDCKSATVQFANGAVPDIGFASPLLYAVAADATEYAQSFHDITSGNNDDFGLDNGELFPARTGYDLASGLGSPILDDGNGEGLAMNLCALATGVASVPTVTGLSPSVGPVSGGGTLTISGTGFSGHGGVKAVSIGADTIPGSDVDVTNGGTTITLTLPAGAATLATPSSSQTDLNTGTTYVSGGSATGQDGAGLADVVVAMGDGTSSTVFANGADTDQFTYVDTDGDNTVPTVTSVSPYAGAQDGGNTLTLYGAGFADGDTVTIGGLSATPVTYVSPTELKVVAPAFAHGTTDCSTQSQLISELENIGNTSDTDPSSDNICQTQVVVTSPSPTESSNGPLPLPTYFGTEPAQTEDGLFEVPEIDGVQYELSPVPDEYDYVPAPTVTSVSTQTTAPLDYANADPGTFGTATPVEVTGTGLNYQTLNYMSIGDPTAENDQLLTVPAYDDGTLLALAAPADPNGTPAAGSEAEALPVTVDTMGGQSSEDHSCTDASPDCITYAGIPEISSITTQLGTDSATGYAAAPDTASAGLTIHGSGLADVAASGAGAPVEFVDITQVGTIPPWSIGTQYQVGTPSDTEIQTETLTENPGIVDTYACSESGCSPETNADLVILYPPGDPVITSIQTASGPPLGGTLVTINGENLGCVTGVYFGSTPAEIFGNTVAILDCGSTSQVEVVAPPGTAGSSVPITLTTVESDLTGAQAASSTTATSPPTEFTYDSASPSVPATVSFGSVYLGQATTELVTLSNPASATQPVYPEPPGPADTSGDTPAVAASIGGANASDFTIANDACQGQTLNPGQSCTIEVQFTPTGLGARAATLDIPWNYSDSVATAFGLQSQTSDFNVSLTGRSIEPTNTVTTTTTKTVTKTCTVTITWRYVTVVVKGKKKRELKKFTKRSSGCPKLPAKKAKKTSKKHVKHEAAKKTSKKHVTHKVTKKLSKKHVTHKVTKKATGKHVTHKVTKKAKSKHARHRAA